MTRTIPPIRQLILALGCLGGLVFGLACADDEPREYGGAEDRSPSALRGDTRDELEDSDELARRRATSPDVAAAPSGQDPVLAGFRDHRSGGVEVVVASVEGIPLLIPSAIFVAEHTKSIQVRNESDTDHTFAIEGIATPRETRIPAGEQVTVQLGDIEPRGIYAIALRDHTDAADASSGVDPELGRGDDPTADEPGRTAIEGGLDRPAGITGADDPTRRPGASGGTLIVLPESRPTDTGATPGVPAPKREERRG